MNPRDTSLDGALFGSDLWKAALEKYGSATRLTVTLFDANARPVFGPVHPTPLFQLFEESGYDPGILFECARRCIAQTRKRPPVLVAQFHGLAVVGASLGLEGKIVGAAVGGYAFADFLQASEVQRLAKESGIVFERVWGIARKQPPVPQQRLIVHGELLQVLGDALLRENYRTRQYEQAAAIVNSSEDAVISEDLDGIATSWNAGAERLFGYAGRDMVGRPVAPLINPGGLHDERALLKRLREGDRIEHHEMVYRHKDQSSVQISLAASPIKGADGAIVGVSKIARDISERKRAEVLLHESEARFRALASVGSSSVFRMSPDWREMRWLDRAGFLAAAEEPTTDWVDTYIPAADRPRVREAIERAIGAKDVFELEHRVLRAEGTVGWTFSRAIPLLDETGEITEWFGAATDVTARVKADQAFTRLFQASPAPFLILKPDAPRFTIAEVNNAYLAATMRTREDVVGRGVFEAFPDNPDDAAIAGVAALRASLERVLATHQPDTLPGLKYDIARPDGTFEERWWSPVNSAVLDENGEVEAIIHNANDVTAEHRAEQALRSNEARVAGQKAAFQAAMNGAPLESSLGILVRTAIEQIDDECRCAFYIADANGSQLRHVIGMPDSYARTIDGFAVSPESLAWGLAAATGRAAITRDVFEEPRWQEWSSIAREYDYRGCWSFPVETAAGKLVGSFAVYFKEPREATARDRDLATAITDAASIIISRHQEAAERARVSQALAQSEQNLSAELAATRQLQIISTELLGESDVQSLHRKVVAAAALIMHADCASMQMLHPERGTNGELQLLASHGFTPEAEKFWEWVRADSGCACGMALRTRRRSIAPDVETCDFMVGTEDQAVYRDAGIRAVQSTPLVSRSGLLLGMLSTHWLAPHEPTERDFRLFDVLAREAADLIERNQAEERQRLLTNELAHRGKNLLAVVQGLVSRGFSGTHSLDEARDTLTQRIQALSRSQSLLLNGGFEGAHLAEIVRIEFEAFSERVDVSGPDLVLNPKSTQAFALLVHELATNATKHGALSRPQGRIAIEWSIEGGGAQARFNFKWQERGGPPVVPPTRTGFGRTLIEKAVAHDFGAQPTLEFDPKGLRYRIDAPLSAVAGGGGRQAALDRNAEAAMGAI